MICDLIVGFGLMLQDFGYNYGSRARISVLVWSGVLFYPFGLVFGSLGYISRSGACI